MGRYMKKTFLSALLGVGAGFLVGKKSEAGKEHLNSDNSIIQDYEERIRTLQATIESVEGNQSIIDDLNQQITSLQAEYELALASVESNSVTISNYEERIRALQATIEANEGSQPVIADLNQQLISLQAEYESALASLESNNTTISNYEETIRTLQATIEANDDNQSLIATLNQQLVNLQAEYDSYVASVGTNGETINGFHFDPNLVFDRSVSDRNISVVGDAISINGVNHFNLPVYVVSQGGSQEIRTKFKSELDEINLNLTGSHLSHQIKIGTKIYQMSAHNTSNLLSEAMVLLEFDKNVNLKEVINKIVIGTANSGDNTQWNNYISGFVALYRANILAFKLYNIMDHSVHNLANLALKATVGNLELPLISAAVVDSMSASVVPNNGLGSSYKLAGNSSPLK